MRERVKLESQVAREGAVQDREKLWVKRVIINCSLSFTVKSYAVNTDEKEGSESCKTEYTSRVGEQLTSKNILLKSVCQTICSWRAIRKKKSFRLISHLPRTRHKWVLFTGSLSTLSLKPGMVAASSVVWFCLGSRNNHWGSIEVVPNTTGWLRGHTSRHPGHMHTSQLLNLQKWLSIDLQSLSLFKFLIGD